jgi:hypothetical protein
MEKSIIIKKKINLCLNSNNDRDNVSNESAFINFKHAGAIKFEVTNEHTVLSDGLK